MQITITFDGLCKPNPGGIATWGVAGWCDNAVKVKERDFIGEGLGITNNMAEWRAALAALRIAQELLNGDAPVRIGGDSELVIKQLRGEYQVHDWKLQPCFEEAQKLRRDLREVEFTHIPRAKNHLADALCRAEYRAIVALKRKYAVMTPAVLLDTLIKMTMEWAGYLDEGFGEKAVPRAFRKEYDLALAEYDRRAR